MSGTVRPRELVAAWVEAFNRADVDALAGFYAEDAVNHQVAESPVTGKAAIREMFRREISDSAQMLRRAYDAGVPLLCGSEAGFSMTPYGDWHFRELEVFVRDLGLSPLQAIQCATQANAFALRLTGQVGEIAAGRLADVIVVDADPTRDIRVLGDRTHLRHVLIGGREVDLKPPGPRRDPPGWRVSTYGARLTRDVALGKTDPKTPDTPEHEL